MQKLAHPDGEIATSRAAAAAGVAMGLSSYSTSAMEDVVREGAGKIDYAMQLYVFQNRQTSEALVRRAEIDTPYLGRRFNELRNRFRLPPHLGLLNFDTPSEVITLCDHSEPTKNANISDASLNWSADLPWLRTITSLPIWIKGILTSEDTHLAVLHGAAGVIVSNHGGRQLDGVPAALDALPECVEAAAGRVPVHVDGGIRRGSDVFKALALGAECCWIGRIPLWGLAYAGEEGVGLALKILEDEFRLCMGLAGCASVGEISKAHLARVQGDGTLARL
ncbi:hypothetical protein Q9L58_004204 [Maublancomyces gigas]|uniref:FMN hydroxy acid dehydrogenase domain-containing protein n=1 Tax=Discina gigas TaxID=1032678 RepID=A0ABR3GLP3_9PEZI